MQLIGEKKKDLRFIKLQQFKGLLEQYFTFKQMHRYFP